MNKEKKVSAHTVKKCLKKVGIPQKSIKKIIYKQFSTLTCNSNFQPSSFYHFNTKTSNIASFCKQYTINTFHKVNF